MFFLFACFSFSEPGALVSQEMTTVWKGRTTGSKVYFATGDGNVYLVDIFTGQVDWGLKTGENTFQAASTSKSLFIPSIDGFLFVHSNIYGYRQMTYPIRDLVFISPIITETDEVFAASKKMILFDVDEKGNLVSSDPIDSSIPSQQYSRKDSNHLIFVRIDYELAIQGQKKIIKYAEFDMMQNIYEYVPIHDVEVIIGFQGGASISVNGTITSQFRLPHFPYQILGTRGKFDFALTVGGEELPKGRVFFLENYYGSPIAFPSAPLQTDLDIRLLMSQLPAISGSVRKEHDVDGIDDIQNTTNKIFYFRPLRDKTDPNRPADTMNDPINLNILSINRFHFPFVATSSILSIIYISVVLINYLMTKLLDAEVSRIRIVADNESEDMTTGTYSGIPCTIVRIKNNPENEEIINGIRDLLIPGIARIKGTEIHDDDILIAYQSLEPFYFDSIDPHSFLKKTMESLLNLFKNGYVHGSITLECLFQDSDGLPLIGGLEKSCRKCENDEERAFDIQSIGRIMSEVLTDDQDPLLVDLLHEMNLPDYRERPTPIEVLKHPYFFSGLQKVNIFLRGSDYLQSAEARRTGKLQKFEARKDQVMGGNWMKGLDPSLLSEAMKFSAYSGDSLADLVRFIRNKWVHSPKNIQDDQNSVTNINKTPDTYFQYFHEKYPNLFLYLYYFLDNDNSTITTM